MKDVIVDIPLFSDVIPKVFGRIELGAIWQQFQVNVDRLIEQSLLLLNTFQIKLIRYESFSTDNLRFWLKLNSRQVQIV